MLDKARTFARRAAYRARHDYATPGNLVVAVALLLALTFVWSSLGVMQRNYALEKELDAQKQQLQLAQLQTANDKLEQSYYKTAEYQQLAARQDLGLALPGEKLLVLPANSHAAIQADSEQGTVAVPVADTNNFEQWINFLFGGDNQEAK